jgi:hypothetical protein
MPIAFCWFCEQPQTFESLGETHTICFKSVCCLELISPPEKCPKCSKECDFDSAYMVPDVVFFCLDSKACKTWGVKQQTLFENKDIIDRLSELFSNQPNCTLTEEEIFESCKAERDEQKRDKE